MGILCYHGDIVESPDGYTDVTGLAQLHLQLKCFASTYTVLVPARQSGAVLAPG